MKRTIIPMFVIAVLAISASSASLADSGFTWQKVIDVTVSLRTHIAGFFSPTQGLSVGYAGASYYTNDGGKTWTDTKNVSYCRWGLDIVGITAISCGNGGQNLMSVDSGKTWAGIADFGSMEPDHCKYLSFIDAKTGWIAAPAALASTSDGGKTWKEMPLPKGIDEIAAIDLPLSGKGKLGFVLGANGFLSVSSDGGATWSTRELDIGDGECTFRNSALGSTSAAMRFTGPKEGFVVAYRASESGSGWVSLNTRDGGASWVVSKVDESIDPDSAVFLSKDGLFLTLFYNDQLYVLKKTKG